MVGLLASLGGIALGFGLLSLLLWFFQPLMPPLLVWGNLVVGVLLLAVSGALGFESLTHRLRSGSGRRAGVHIRWQPVKHHWMTLLKIPGCSSTDNGPNR